jgi:hypothetical protein
MYFDPLRYPASADGERTEDPETGEPFDRNEIGWIDPRAVDEDRGRSPQKPLPSFVAGPAKCEASRRRAGRPVA